MTVGQTIEFATSLKTPAHAMKDKQSRIDHREKTIDFLLRSMGISHTRDTAVGNEYVRGVSGGERKRLSIIETLATRAAVVCWDNSTRGKSGKQSCQVDICS
jgi:ATP-binding cassette subfamily G (WHITE) protein 2 (SNQ2)